ncbi:MFS transporter [Salinispora oceanensis]|uniref:MFS transporter n=1 Tax=Salinispora oceanensis TaxID=1050199 RepID=UPI0003786D69|nr:MFS transporter [Salinispora oceanensis]
MSAHSAVRSRRPLIALLAAHGISLTGNAMTLLSVPWFVLQATGSPVQTGLAATATFLPILLSTSLGGVLIDRIGYRRAGIACDLISGAMIALIPLLHLLDLLPLPVLLALVFLSALFDAPSSTARLALLPTLAEHAGTTIERASSAMGVVERVSRMIGAPIAGGLLVLIGPANVLLVDAGTFVASALILALSVVPGRGGRAAADTSFGRGLKAGFAHVWNDRLLLAITLLIAVTNVLDVAYVGVVLPVYGDQVLSGVSAVGLVIGTSAVAAVIGGLVFGAVLFRLPRRALVTVAFMLVGLPRCLILALEPGLLWVLVTAAATGFFAGMLNPILNTVQYKRVPEEIRARALGAMFAATYAVAPLGPLVGGALIASQGLTVTLLLFAGVYAMAALSLLLPLRVWQGFDESADQPREKATV